MSTKGHKTGSRAVHLVCAKLIENDFITTITSRNAPSIDILAFKNGKSYSIQVKSNSSNVNFLLVGKNYNENIDDSHFYIFVNLAKNIEDTLYFTLSSKDVSEHTYVDTKTKSTWYSITRDFAKQNHNEIFFKS